MKNNNPKFKLLNRLLGTQVGAIQLNLTSHVQMRKFIVEKLYFKLRLVITSQT